MIYDLEAGARNIKNMRTNQSNSIRKHLYPGLKPPSKIAELKLKE
jgi:hypothetical protein